MLGGAKLVQHKTYCYKDMYDEVHMNCAKHLDRLLGGAVQQMHMSCCTSCLPKHSTEPQPRTVRSQRHRQQQTRTRGVH
jgi:hypothetical protein